MKNLVVLAMMVIGLQSCVAYYEEPDYGYDGRNGRAYFKLNWMEQEPVYVDAGGVVPNNFYWDTFYRTSEGIYTVYYESEYQRYGRWYIQSYEVVVEVFQYRGEQGGYYYDGRDGKDVYFELQLYPDGYFDYTYAVLRSAEKQIPDEKGRTFLGVKEEIKDGVKVVLNYYAYPEREKTK
ncbi:MAG: hypothetical protein LBM68_04370 [Bacteroidales bacterium]|jgi:hypothetical protein|nr:hypothetical protein [Bacteroidales bacterium]